MSEHEAYAAGLLHDVIEDTPRTAEDIQSRFGEDVAVAVQMLTRRADVSLDEYIAGMNEANTPSPRISSWCSRPTGASRASWPTTSPSV